MFDYYMPIQISTFGFCETKPTTQVFTVAFFHLDGYFSGFVQFISWKFWFENYGNRRRLRWYCPRTVINRISINSVNQYRNLLTKTYFPSSNPTDILVTQYSSNNRNEKLVNIKIWGQKKKFFLLKNEDKVLKKSRQKKYFFDEKLCWKTFLCRKLIQSKIWSTYCLITK